jgi:hypothetical protein
MVVHAYIYVFDFFQIFEMHNFFLQMDW